MLPNNPVFAAVLLRNSWEDKFFSMLMLGENEQAQQQAQAAIDAMNGGPISDASLDAAIANETGALMNSRRQETERLGLSRQDSERSLSSVSDTEPI